MCLFICYIFCILYQYSMYQFSFSLRHETNFFKLKSYHMQICSKNI